METLLCFPITCNHIGKNSIILNYHLQEKKKGQFNVSISQTISRKSVHDLHCPKERHLVSLFWKLYLN